ncbi:MAG: NAD-dependent epimerase/dehydratase family protein [Planctomycetota bacterium]
MYSGKNVLVTGGTGLIGRPLVEMLIEHGARVRIASIDDSSRAHPKAEYQRVDLMKFDNCLKVCRGMDYVFHLAGIKGSPAVVLKKAATIFVSFLRFNTNMMEAARQCQVKRYLFTSTVGVYPPAEVFKEDDVWKGFPSEKDKYGGWAKRMGELQAEAYRVEYGWNKVAIVRPANVYGPYDNFDPDNAMVIPSLVERAIDGEDPFVVWGDGSAVRDFIHAKDVARGMLIAIEKAVGQAINLGSGTGVTIKRIVEIIINNLETKLKVVWDTSKPSGDRKRLMDMSRANAIGFRPAIGIEEGIKEVMLWYRENKDIVSKRHNVLT